MGLLNPDRFSKCHINLIKCPQGWHFTQRMEGEKIELTLPYFFSYKTGFSAL